MSLARHLRYLRHITLWTLLMFVGVVVISVGFELLNRSRPVPELLALAVAAAICCAVSAHFMIASVAPGGPPPMTRRVRIAFALAAAGALIAPVLSAPQYGSGQLPTPWVFLPGLLTSAAVAGSGLPRVTTTLVGTVLTVVAATLGAGVAGHELVPAVVVALLVALVSSGAVGIQVWVWDVAAQVDRARQVEGAAAVAEERLRFAAELHDIQGHSLQVIALKSELAARLVDTDPARAVAEMREVESLAREALRDTREVAHGYRTVSLTTEITNATRVLAAAGIRCATHADDDLPHLAPAAERLLGLVVREATTNVIRHSRAAHAEIALTHHDGGVRLLVGNDAPLVTDDPRTGGGLAGLAERFTAAGGALDWRREADAFTVTAEVASR